MRPSLVPGLASPGPPWPCMAAQGQSQRVHGGQGMHQFQTPGLPHAILRCLLMLRSRIGSTSLCTCLLGQVLSLPPVNVVCPSGSRDSVLKHHRRSGFSPFGGWISGIQAPADPGSSAAPSWFIDSVFSLFHHVEEGLGALGVSPMRPLIPSRCPHPDDFLSL